MNDPRFDSYHERRYTHLIKLAMVLCALRGYTCIDKADYQEAHRILRATEKGMPDALGQFGMKDRKSVVSGKSVYVRVDLGGRRIIKKTNKQQSGCSSINKKQ